MCYARRMPTPRTLWEAASPIDPSNDRAGIYLIYCLSSKRGYIGSTRDLRSRWLQHLSSLRLGEHFNSHLQRAWLKYGEDQFVACVLAEFSARPDPPQVLVDQENVWLSSVPRALLYNVVIPATIGCPELPPEIEAQRVARIKATSATPESKARRSAASLEVLARPGVKEKLRAAQYARWTEEARREQGERTRIAAQRPEVQAARHAAGKANHKDPEYKAKWSATRSSFAYLKRLSITHGALDEADVRLIRKETEHLAKLPRLPRGTLIPYARKFGVTVATIHNLIRRKTWRHLED